MQSASAIAFPNIAFIKYWGDRDPRLRIPANGSISMNLDGLFTRTQVTFDPALQSDQLSLNGRASHGHSLQRVKSFLDQVRHLAHIETFAQISSENNFPTGAGIASSASAFAALSLAASAAAGLTLNEMQLSRLARTGSGSACRSVPGGFVEWLPGESDADSYAISLAPPEHWDLVDCIAIVSREHKATGSTQGHPLAATSPLYKARLASVPRLLEQCRAAILQRDFEALATVTELDCHQMHAVMMTSDPPLLYWLPATLAVLHQVRAWRKSGLPVCYTIDAGPNVHVICAAEVAERITRSLEQVRCVQRVLKAHPGGPARLEFC